MRLFFADFNGWGSPDSRQKEKSEILLERALGCYLGENRPAEGWTSVLRHTETGKPYFADGRVRFSVSHSGQRWICLMADQEVAIDIEREAIRDYEKIARRFFSPEEIDYVQKQGQRGFLEIWTGKEAYVKITGTTLWSAFKEISMVKDGRIAPSVKGYLVKDLPFFSGYRCTYLCQRPEPVRLLDLDGIQSE